MRTTSVTLGYRLLNRQHAENEPASQVLAIGKKACRESREPGLGKTYRWDWVGAQGLIHIQAQSSPRIHRPPEFRVIVRSFNSEGTLYAF